MLVYLNWHLNLLVYRTREYVSKERFYNLSFIPTPTVSDFLKGLSTEGTSLSEPAVIVCYEH